jgi:VanZ family protein
VVIAWLTRRLPADQRLHFVVCALLATAAAHAAPAWCPPWAAALIAAGVIGGAFELWQTWAGTGDGTLNDLAADLAGGAVVALATLA